jgi:aspartate kinase
MVGEAGYDYRLMEHLDKANISYITKNTNANTITHYVPERSKGIDKCLASIKAAFPNAVIDTDKVAVVSVIGSNMKIPGFLARAAKALFDANINVLALDQTMRQVNIQFVIERAKFKEAQIVLHREFVEKEA